MPQIKLPAIALTFLLAPMMLSACSPDAHRATAEANLEPNIAKSDIAATGTPTRLPPATPLSASTRADKTSTAAPPGPVSTSGPWLVWPNGNREIVAAGIDGLGSEIIASPSSVNNDCQWIEDLVAAPSGGHVAFKCRAPGSVDELWVLDIPTGKVVSHTRLLGEAASAADATPDEEYFFLPPPAAFSVQMDSLHWSPDGRYLAFVGAVDGPTTDVYVVDVQSGETRRLTTGPDQALILGWSPDSRWIVHASFTHGESDIYVRTLWAVSVDSRTVARLFDIEGWIASISIEGWRTNSQVITDVTAFEGCTTDLRLTEIGGSSQRIFPAGFSSATYDPIRDQVVIAQGGNPYCRADKPGLWSSTPDSPEFTRISDKSYWGLRWSTELNLVVGNNSNGGLDLVSRDGNPVAHFDDAYSISPSPSGEWIIVTTPHRVFLASALGEEQNIELPEKYFGIDWDTSAVSFIMITCELCGSNGITMRRYANSSSWVLSTERTYTYSIQSPPSIVVVN